MTINEQQDAVIEEFSEIDDWMDKYQMLIDLGNELDVLKEQYKTGIPAYPSSKTVKNVYL